MRVVSQYCLTENQSWSTPFSATPYFIDGCGYFPYGLPGAVGCVKLGLDGSMTVVTGAVPPGESVHHPHGWKIFPREGRIILSCGGVSENKQGSLFFDLDAMEAVTIPEKIARQHLCPPPIRETENVSLGDYLMRYKNSRSLQCCRPDGTVIWEEKHKGYRYTPFEVKNGCVIFGTAGGHGGGLCCYRLTDGECLCAVDTKGTARYCWHGDRILSRGRKGELLWIDPFGNQITDFLTLDAKLNDDSGIFTDGRYICTVGFREKKQQLLPIFYLIDTQDK